MDRNSVIGLVLIGLLVIGYSIYMQPSAEQIAAMKRQRDSVEAVQKKALADSAYRAQNAQQEQQKNATAAPNDSVKAEQLHQQLDVFSGAGQGTEEFVTV